MTDKQPPLDLIAQLVAKYEANGQHPTQLPTTLQPSQKSKWTGFTGKTLWDWLNLIAVLLVPLMIGVFTLAITIQQTQLSKSQHDSDQKIAADNRQKDIQIAADQQQAATLKAYLDDMTDLMLNHGLRLSKSDDEVRVVARAKTLTALRGLNGDRKVALIHFLYEAKLLGGLKDTQDVKSRYAAIVSLEGADLSKVNLESDDLAGVDLRFVNLDEADLGGINLSGAVLSGAELIGANLGGAIIRAAVLNGTDLREANLQGADLSYADLSGVEMNTAEPDVTLSVPANLREADLSEANLQGADLSHVELSGADLSHAYFRDAKVTKEQLAEVRLLVGATLPDGSRYPSQSYPIPNHKEP